MHTLFHLGKEYVFTDEEYKAKFESVVDQKKDLYSEWNKFRENPKCKPRPIQDIIKVIEVQGSIRAYTYRVIVEP